MRAARAEPSADAALGVPWWGVASSAAAPGVLLAGWTIAAWLQRRPYDAVRQTVSVLAAHGAADRWVMTLAFFAVGGCDVITGLAVRGAARAGRTVIVVGGIAGILVAANPETVGRAGSVVADGSLRHAVFAAVGFVALTIWPVAAARPGEAERGGPAGVPWALRPAAAAVASALTAVLFCWFLIELVAGGGQLGLAERVLGEVQALWPLVVVASGRAYLKDSRTRSQMRSQGVASIPKAGRAAVESITKASRN